MWLLCVPMEEVPVVEAVPHVYFFAGLYLSGAFDEYLLFFVHGESGIGLESQMYWKLLFLFVAFIVWALESN